MMGHSYDPALPQLDITAPEGDVEVEIDSRGVLYVHVEGFTALRICRIVGKITVRQKLRQTHSVSTVQTVTPPADDSERTHNLPVTKPGADRGSVPRDKGKVRAGRRPRKL